MLVQQAVPQPAEEEQASTGAQLSSAGRYPPGFVPARASQGRKKGKGRAYRPLLQQPVASSVLPCLHKLELHITGWQFISIQATWLLPFCALTQTAWLIAPNDPCIVVVTVCWTHLHLA